MANRPERAEAGKTRLPTDWQLATFVVIICATLSAIMRISIDSFAVFLLPLTEEFGWARSKAVSIYGISMLSFGLGCLLAGRLMDRVGPRWTYSLGLTAIATVFLTAERYDALWQFTVALGVIVGASAALIGMVSHAVLLSRWFQKNLTSAISLSFAASGVGMLTGAPILQSMIEASGWREAYFSLGMFVAMLAIIMPFLPWRRLEARTPQSLYRPGRDGRAAGHVTLKAVLYDRGLLAMFCIQFLTAISMFALNAQIVAMLVHLGFDPVRSALTFGAAGIAGSIGVVLFGWLTDRRGRRLTISLSYVMTIAGFSVLLFLLQNPSWSLVILFIAIYGPTFGSRGPIMNAMVPALAGRGHGLGFKIGFVQLGMGMGAAVGSISGGWLHDVSGYESVVWLSIISAFLALTLYWSVKRIRQL